MALLKILAAAACVAAAVAVAPKVLNEDGNVLLQVGPAKRVGFQAGSDAATYLDELQLAAESSESLSYLHLGYQNACVALRGVAWRALETSAGRANVCVCVCVCVDGRGENREERGVLISNTQRR